MRAALAIALGVVGCFSDRGIAIEVDIGTTAAISVELFLGKAACGAPNEGGISCDSIAPPGATVPLGGKDGIWFRDAEVRYTATVHGRTATFRLQADTATTLPIVIAVGSASTDASAPPVGVATLYEVPIPVDGARIATTTLVEILHPVDLTTDPQVVDPPEDRALVWLQRNGNSSCVVVEHWDTAGVTRQFVVPADDPDCDGLELAAECNPAAYLGKAAPGASAVPDCFAMPGGACVLASHGCTDAEPPGAGDCVALTSTTTCVPSAFCGCDAMPGTCIQDNLALATVPKIVCTVPTRAPAADAGLCSDKTAAVVDVSALYSPEQCDREPMFRSVALGPGAPSRDFNGARMEVTGKNDPCGIQIVWKDGNHAVGEVRGDLGVIELESGGRSVLVPISFEFIANDCAAESKFDCVFHDSVDDSMWSCTR